jgi:Zn-finger domain-containing protein
MVRILKQEKRGIVKTVTLVIKVMEDGRWVRKRVTIDANDEGNYEK